MAESLNTNDEKAAGALPVSMTEDDSKPVFPGFHPDDETYPWNDLPKTIRGAVIELCKNEGLAVPIAAQVVLSAVSLSCQDLIWVDRGIAVGQRSPCSLFFLAVSDSGSRKSRADQLIIAPIKKYDQAKTAEFDEAMARYGLEQAALKRDISELEKVSGQLFRHSIKLSVSSLENANELALRAAAEAEKAKQKLAELERQLIADRKPRHQKTLYEKISINQLWQCLAQNHPSACLDSDEAAGILNSKGEADMASLDKLWDAGSLDVVGRTKQETFFVHDPRLTLSLMVQPIAFDRFIERKGELAKGIGLMSRLFLSRPDTPYGKRFFVKQEDLSTIWIDRFNARVKELLVYSHRNTENREENRVTLHFESDAQLHWEEMYNAVERSMATNRSLENEREFANRVAEHVARLAALFHFFEYGNVEDKCGAEIAIPKSSVEAAISVVHWYHNEFRRVFNQEARMQEMATYVLSKFKDLLEKINGGPLEDCRNFPETRVPVQELRSNCSKYGLKKIENFRPVLEYLHRNGNVTVRERSRSVAKVPNPPKRSSECVEINYRPHQDKYEFFFDLKNPWCNRRSR
jgi:hypothetical protein